MLYALYYYTLHSSYSLFFNILQASFLFFLIRLLQYVSAGGNFKSKYSRF